MQAMNNEEKKISDEALMWVKSHQKDIVQKFAGPYPSVSGTPISIFMAGSPGAGKTEFSKSLLLLLRESVVCIDPDEVRNFLPQYVPGRAHLFQGAVSIAIEKIHDYVLRKEKDFLLDGTFSNRAKARENIRRSLEKGRTVLIQYVYQDPLVAWDFTKKREAIEGRNIPKESFIEQLFAARDNVDAIKSEFENRVTVDLVRRNIQTDTYDMEIDVRQVADKVLAGYTKDNLLKQL
jgi:UDP-N-acetylglucosamine kinase